MKRWTQTISWLLAAVGEKAAAGQRFCRAQRGGVVLLVAAGLATVIAGVAPGQGRADAAQAPPSARVPEFTLALDRGLGSFYGFGGQFNQHVFADISGPPPDLPGLEAKVLALGPRYVRVFFNNSEWTFPDRMASFVRTVQLANRAEATIEVAWQGGTFAFAMQNMPRFADVLADLLEHRGIVGSLWVSLYNEPNSALLTLDQYQQTYRLLDAEVRARGVRDRIHFMGGGILGTTSGLGQSQGNWYWYMATYMGDLLEAWAPHIYWDFWDTPKIERRLTEVRASIGGIPEQLRRPLYITEFGVRGLRTFEGEITFEPGFYPDGTPMAATTKAAFEEAWFMIRATQLGYVAAAKWDLYDATYDVGTQDYSAIGPGVDGWPIRPDYRLLQLMTLTTKPVGGSIVDVIPAAGADLRKLLTAYTAPSGDVTILGLDTDGAAIAAGSDPVVYSLGGLPPNARFRLLVWNADGSGTNIEIGFVDTDSDGTIEFSVPLQGVFALTTVPLGSLPW
jgi:hypothetical protein